MLALWLLHVLPLPNYGRERDERGSLSCGRIMDAHMCPCTDLCSMSDFIVLGHLERECSVFICTLTHAHAHAHTHTHTLCSMSDFIVLGHLERESVLYSYVH